MRYPEHKELPEIIGDIAAYGSYLFGYIFAQSFSHWSQSLKAAREGFEAYEALEDEREREAS